MATAATTTRPARGRKPAAKAVEPTPVETSAEVPVSADNSEAVQRFRVTLEHTGSSKNYEIFEPPKSSGCFAKFYAPRGTATVKVLLEGPA